MLALKYGGVETLRVDASLLGECPCSEEPPKLTTPFTQPQIRQRS
jgi:hypothetical protein